RDIHHAHVAELAADLLRGLLADEVELRAADLRTADDGDGFDRRRIEREDLLDADARKRRADREGRARLRAVLHRKDEAFERLRAGGFDGLLLLVGALPLLHLDDLLLDAHGV